MMFSIESKYYTPEIEEFHVGFEYEIKSPKKEQWIKKVCQSFDVREVEISQVFDMGIVRVKVLDIEDVESLGFDNYEPPYEYDHTWHYKGSKEPVIKVWFNNPIPVVRIYNSFPATSFHGWVKNKSELKRLMAQLGLNER